MATNKNANVDVKSIVDQEHAAGRFSWATIARKF